MTRKNTILATGFVLWILGVLVGAGTADLIPEGSSIPSGVILVVALLASLGNFAVLYRKVQ